MEARPIPKYLQGLDWDAWQGRTLPCYILVSHDMEERGGWGSFGPTVAYFSDDAVMF